MPKKLNADTYFNLIKQNHKNYLEQNMVTHLELTGGLKQAELIEGCVGKIALYHKDRARYLDHAIQQPSTGEKAKQGALAALIGQGAGKLAGYALQNMPIASSLTSLASAINLPSGGAFSTVLSAGVAYLVYQAWKENPQNAAANDFEAFQKEMKEAGFTDEKYAELSAELVKLFHFRECVLLGFADSVGDNMREEFKKKYFLNASLNDEALNTAIEVYFLGQLNQLFTNAFKDIYVVDDQDIEVGKNQASIGAWIKQYFANSNDRQKFTQQIQLDFMNLCLNFLEEEMSEPSFFAKHPYAMASISGLIAGAVALGVASAVLGGPITLGIAAIALVIACLAAVAVYFAVNHIEALKFKRNAANRSAIKDTVDKVTKEAERLKRLIENVVETTPEDLAALQKFENEAVTHTHLLGLVGENQNIAMGAGTAWLREYASRYRHSKVIEIDFKDKEKDIFGKAVAQTEALQEQLKSALDQKDVPQLQQYIQDTQTYLADPENKNFIQTFQLVEKIKQQVLEIVSVIPAGQKLPQPLVEFYTQSLGGLDQELEQARKMAPILADEVAVNKDHPYHLILETAQGFNYALTQDENRAFILLGDAEYRGMLGLRVDSPHERIENKINSSNIQRYLNSSFEFLYSLNQEAALLDTPFNNSNEFILYRTLLIKQLASLADPHNLRVDASVRGDIEKFVNEKLQLDPKIVFPHVLNQMLFIEKNDKGPVIQDPLGINRSVNNLGYVADAMRVDLAYASKPMTPRRLIALEASDFLLANADSEKTLFSHQNSAQVLTPESTPEYVEKIKQAIETTKLFIAAMAEKNELKKSGALASYLLGALNEIQSLQNQISKLDRIMANTLKPTAFNSPILKEASQLLQGYEKELQAMLPTTAPQKLQDLVASGKVKEEAPHLFQADEQEGVRDDEGVLTPQILEAFEKDIQSYIDEVKEEPEPFAWFGFFSNPKQDKIKAAMGLKAAVGALKAGNQADISFLDTMPKDIEDKIRPYLQQLNVRSLLELFHLQPAPALLPQ